PEPVPGQGGVAGIHPDHLPALPGRRSLLDRGPERIRAARFSGARIGDRGYGADRLAGLPPSIQPAVSRRLQPVEGGARFHAAPAHGWAANAAHRLHGQARDSAGAVRRSRAIPGARPDGEEYPRQNRRATGRRRAGREEEGDREGFRPLGYGHVLGGSGGRGGLALSPRGAPPGVGGQLPPPRRRATPPLAAPACQPLQAENRLFELLSFVPQFGQDFADIHSFRPPFGANSRNISFAVRFRIYLILPLKSCILDRKSTRLN